MCLLNINFNNLKGKILGAKICWTNSILSSWLWRESSHGVGSLLIYVPLWQDDISIFCLFVAGFSASLWCLLHFAIYLIFIAFPLNC